MKNMSRTISALAVAFLLSSAVSASAQVEQVAIKAGGLACGTCALVSEVNLRKLEGIEGVSISLSQEAVLVSYKPGAPFRPQAILQVFEPLEVTVRQVQISARGSIQEQGGRRILVAGKDNFVLVDNPSSPKPPATTPILVQAVLLDSKTVPMPIRVMTFKPLAP